MATGDATWKVGTFTIPGSTGNIAVTGLGGTPAAVFFFGTNFLTEDTAVTTAHLGIGRGMAAPKWDDPGTIIQYFSYAAPSGDCFNVGDTGCMLAMDTSGTATNLYALSFTSFDADGFTVFSAIAAAGGYQVVWVALMDVSDIGAYKGTDSNIALGWKAGAAMAMGSHSGNINAATSDTTANWYAGGAYPGSSSINWEGAGLAALTFPPSSGAQYNIGVFDDNPAIAITQTGAFVGPFLSPQDVLAYPNGVGNTDFQFTPTTANFGAVVVWEDEDTRTGRLTPDDTQGGTVTVSGLPFRPGLVIGYSISDEPQGLGTGGRGALGFSVATPTFQWTALCDGSSNQGSFQSFQRGMSSVVNGTDILAGTVTLTSDGFIVTTEEDTASPADWVWHVFGHPDRILKWIPHIYRRITDWGGGTGGVPPTPPPPSLLLLEDGGRLELEDGSGFLELE